MRKTGTSTAPERTRNRNYYKTDSPTGWEKAIFEEIKNKGKRYRIAPGEARAGGVWTRAINHVYGDWRAGFPIVGKEDKVGGSFLAKVKNTIVSPYTKGTKFPNKNFARS